MQPIEMYFPYFKDVIKIPCVVSSTYHSSQWICTRLALSCGFVWFYNSQIYSYLKGLLHQYQSNLKKSVSKATLKYMGLLLTTRHYDITELKKHSRIVFIFQEIYDSNYMHFVSCHRGIQEVACIVA